MSHVFLLEQSFISILAVAAPKLGKKSKLSKSEYDNCN